MSSSVVVASATADDSWRGVDVGSPPPYSVQDQIWDTAKQSLPSVPPEKPLVIAVMGPTGTGKSTLISKLAGREMNIGHNLSSCTQECEEVPCKVGDKYVILVDTPGFNDTERSDTEILYSLAEWMKDSYDDDILLSGIIYLHSISDARMTNSSLQNLRMFRKLCGDDNLKNVILVTTKWGITPEEDAHRRERDLTSENGFWGTMIAAGSSVRRFENSNASAKSLVEDILYGGQRFMPKIQEEVVQGKKLADTEAGAFINDALNNLQEKYQEEKEALTEEVKLAERSRKCQLFPGNTIMTSRCLENQRMQEALKRECRRLERQVAEKEEEQRILHMDYVEALQNRIQMYAEKEVEQREQHTNNVEALQNRIKRLEESKKKMPRVKLGFWHLNWKCLVCKRKHPNEGCWTCPNCGFVQENVY
ncbi:MAG: hypothetical protein Q9191_003951 [Dirinaria sp. TL-2023a]